MMTYTRAVNHLTETMLDYKNEAAANQQDILLVVSNALLNHASVILDGSDLHLAARVLRGLAKVDQ